MQVMSESKEVFHEIIMENKVNSAEDQVHNLISCLSKFKINYINEKEEFKKLREINEKLEVQLKETRELEKSHRYHLLKSREMIGNLQETVSQLVYLKRDLLKLKDELAAKDAAISAVEKDKENLIEKNKENLLDLRNAHETEIKEITASHERKVEQIQHEADTQVAQFTCVIEELRTKIKEMEVEHKEKINMVVLEYEEKVQRGESQNAQLQDELTRRAARAEANFEAYRRRMGELEEQLKQSKFRHQMAKTSYMNQIDHQTERCYSDLQFVSSNEIKSSFQGHLSKNLTKSPLADSQFNKRSSQPNRLPVIYQEAPVSGDKKTMNNKGPFNLSKKRKLYTDKEFELTN